MQEYQRESVTSILAFFGVIFILLGIFAPFLEFELGLIIGVFIFFITGAFYEFFDDKKNVDEKKIEILTIIITAFGVTFILAGIFLEISFWFGLVGGISLFFLAGIINHYLSSEMNFKEVELSQRNSDDDKSNESFNIIENTEKEGLRKESLKCTNCGTISTSDDQFCFNCGNRLY